MKQVCRDNENESGCRAHSLAKRYLHILFRKNADTAISLLLKAVSDGMPLKELYLSVLQPAQYELGSLWQSGKISVADEHYCTAATQQVMSRLYPVIFSTPKNGKVMIAACVKGELHEIGLRMVADLFELDGWDTHFFSASTKYSTVLRKLTDNQVNLLALSATMTSHVKDIKQIIDTVHNLQLPAPVKIMVGGYPFNADPELWRQIGADSTARGAAEAVCEGNRICATR